MHRAINNVVYLLLTLSYRTQQQLSTQILVLLPQLCQMLERAELREVILSIFNLMVLHTPDKTGLYTYFHSTSLYPKLVRLLTHAFSSKPASASSSTHGGLVLPARGSTPSRLSTQSAMASGTPAKSSAFDERSKSLGLLTGTPVSMQSYSDWSGWGKESGGDGTNAVPSEEWELERRRQKTASVTLHLILAMAAEPVMAEAIAVEGLMSLFTNDSLYFYSLIGSVYTEVTCCQCCSLQNTIFLTQNFYRI